MRRTILIAESDDDQRNLFERYFRQLAFDVRTATSGLDCVELLRQERPKVLLLDEHLAWGGADGVLDCLREESRDDSVPVILMAGTGQLLDKEMPVVACVEKPFSLSLLSAMVDAALTTWSARHNGKPGSRQKIRILRAGSNSIRVHCEEISQDTSRSADEVVHGTDGIVGVDAPPGNLWPR